MGKYYSPKGNFEVWDKKPVGYYTEEEWAELHPPTPYVPTKEEKKQAIIAQYESDKAELQNQLVEAILYNDTALQEEIKADMADVDAQFDADIKELEG